MSSLRHRHLYVLNGAAAWVRAAAHTAIAQVPDALWIGGGAPENVRALDARSAAEALGGEFDAVVYDAHAGFDPDAFGAIAGTVRGGGCIILLAPALDEWPAYDDPYHARMATPPYSARDVTGRFLARLVRVLREAQGVTLLGEGEAPVISCGSEANLHADPGDCRTDDQRRAVDAIMKVVHGHRRRPLILTSDRGRGKSAALGIAAARLLREGVESVLVTGPSLQSVAPVFDHAARLLAGAHCARGLVRFGNGNIEFVAPDALTLAPRETNLLLVDEAAAIPAPLLRSMLARYARVAFATTVHGYEGTGRGFAVRFQRELERTAPSHRSLVLNEPIRWSVDDPVEKLVSRALMLDAQPAEESRIGSATHEACTFEVLNRDALARDEDTLRQLFGLLVLAHYRTTPGDLRDLLDGPNLCVHAARFDGDIVAAALVAGEELDATLASQVFEGRRRVRGNLLPQTLVYHSGLEEAAQLRYARVVRIAVHPAVQARGIGTALLEHAMHHASAAQCDVIGASFGATPQLLRWWRNAGFMPVRIGQTREASSGTHAAILLRALSERSGEICRRARGHLLEALPMQLATSLRDLDAHVAAEVLRGQGEGNAECGALSPRERRDLHAFAYASRGEDICLPALRRLALAVLMRGEPDAGTAALLVARVLQHRRGGRAEAAQLRVVVAEALRAPMREK